MYGTDGPTLDWREFVRAVPGAIAIQVGDEFVCANDNLATTFGMRADSLVGQPWHAPFDDDEAKRLQEEAIEPARTDGHWKGRTQSGGARPDATPIEVELTSIGNDALVWVIKERTPPGHVGRDEPTERQSRLFSRPEFVRTVLDAIDDVFYVIDDQGESYLWNETLVETTGYTHEEIATMAPKDFVPEDQYQYVPGLLDAIDAIEDRRVEVDILTKHGERITHEFKGTTFEDPVSGRSYRCGLARDITERLEHERELERKLDELATLDRINELLLEIARELVQTASREAVERTVCDRLVASDLYEFAWIGGRDFDGDRIVPWVDAGAPQEYLDAVTVADGGGDLGRGPAGQAIQTGEVQVVDIEDAEFGPGREEARRRGVESVMAVPLHHAGTVYGVLVVHATREDAFREREQAGFDVLGRTVGFVIHAARSRELLFADSVVELEFQLDADITTFGQAAGALGCDLSLEGYVASGGRWVLYIAVDGAPARDVIDIIADDSRFERCRVISDDGSGLIELVASASPLLDTTTAAGAIVRTATAGPDSSRLVVEAPVGADIRRIVEHVRREYPGAELLARRERDRPLMTVDRPGGLFDELTDRQREALEAAYRSGYFAWPRESTAEEVAQALDIAPSTFHAHLRKAEAVVLAALFDAASSNP